LSEHRFIDRSNWKEIKRGHVFDAAMFYNSDTKRPLTFFVPDETQVEGEPVTGKLVPGNGDFTPIYDDDDTPKSQEHRVVVGMKNRRVVVVTNDFFNQNESYQYIYVAPIMSVKDKDKEKKWYEKMIRDEHPTFVFVPSSEGSERYVNITQVMSIHKGTLLRNVHEVIGSDRMIAINNSLIDCFDLGLVEEEDVHQIIEGTGTEG
jgi:uncharacterized protein YifN (PemK superfamily)